MSSYSKAVSIFMGIILVWLGFQQSMKIIQLDDDDTLLHVSSEAMFDQDIRDAYFASVPYLEETRKKIQERDQGNYSAEILFLNFFTRFTPETTNAYPGYSTLRYFVGQFYETINPWHENIQVPHIAQYFCFVMICSLVVLWWIFFLLLSRIRNIKLIHSLVLLLFILLIIDSVLLYAGLGTYRLLPIQGLYFIGFGEILEFAAAPGMRYGLFAYDGRTFATAFFLIALISKLDGRYKSAAFALSLVPLCHAAQGSAIVVGLIVLDIFFRAEKYYHELKYYAFPILSSGVAASLMYESYLYFFLLVIFGVILFLLQKSKTFRSIHEAVLNMLPYPRKNTWNELFKYAALIVASFVGGYIIILLVDDLWVDFKCSQLPARVLSSCRPCILFLCCFIVIERIYTNKKNSMAWVIPSALIAVTVAFFVSRDYYSYDDYQKDLIQRCYQLEAQVRERNKRERLDYTNSAENTLANFDALKGKASWFDNDFQYPSSIIPAMGNADINGFKVSGSDSDAEHPPLMVVDDRDNGWAARFRPTIDKPAYIKIELPEAEDVQAYSFLTRNNRNPSCPQDWTVEGSNDDKDWTLLDEQRDQFKFNPRGFIQGYKIKDSKPYKWYRFSFTASRNYQPDVDLDEIELYKDVSKDEYQWMFISRL